MVNNAAINVRYKYPFDMIISLPVDKYTEVELLDHMEVHFLTL